MWPCPMFNLRQLNVWAIQGFHMVIATLWRVIANITIIIPITPATSAAFTLATMFVNLASWAVVHGPPFPSAPIFNQLWYFVTKARSALFLTSNLEKLLGTIMAISRFLIT